MSASPTTTVSMAKSTKRRSSVRRIYVPVLHGIGARDHDRFASKSVSRIATYIRDAASGWEETTCPGTCDYASGHRHLLHVSGAQAVIDPISWFSVLTRPRRRDTARWFARSIFLLCCVHLLVNGWSIWRAFSGDTSLSAAFRHPIREISAFLLATWRVIRAMMWMLVISVLAVLALLIATPLIFLIPHAHRLAGDALGWTSSDNMRESVLSHVTARVNRADSDHVLLIGHSQGGAIAAAAAQRRPRGRTSLITLGSGIAALDPIRLGREISTPSVVGMTLAVAAYIGAALLLLQPLLAAGFTAFGTFMLETASVGAAFWAIGFAPNVSLNYLEAATQLTAHSVAVTIGAQPRFEWMFVAFLLTIPIVVIYIRTLRPVAERVIAGCQITLPGADLCATFDPVSFPLLALGPPERVLRVTQSASLADHVRYFSNRTEVLHTIDAELTRIATGERPTGTGSSVADDAAASRVLRKEARSSARTARVARASTALVAFASAIAACPALPWLAVGLAASAYAAGTVVMQLSWARRQRHPITVTARRFGRRPTHSGMHAILSLVAAASMIGAMLVRWPVPSVMLAAVCYPLLMIAFFCAVGRAVGTAYIAAIAVALTAIAWVLQDTAFGAVVATLLIALSTTVAVRQFRRGQRAKHAFSPTSSARSNTSIPSTPRWVP